METPTAVAPYNSDVGSGEDRTFGSYQNLMYEAMTGAMTAQETPQHRVAQLQSRPPNQAHQGQIPHAWGSMPGLPMSVAAQFGTPPQFCVPWMTFPPYHQGLRHHVVEQGIHQHVAQPAGSQDCEIVGVTPPSTKLAPTAKPKRKGGRASKKSGEAVVKIEPSQKKPAANNKLWENNWVENLIHIRCDMHEEFNRPQKQGIMIKVL